MTELDLHSNRVSIHQYRIITLEILKHSLQ